MAQTKKKQSTKTAKKTTSAAKTHKKSTSRTTCKKNKGISNEERWHVYIETSLSIVAGILLCADAAMISLA